MMHWDIQMKQADLRGRLARIGLPNAGVYGVACATHAKDHISQQAEGQHDLLWAISDILSRFWNGYPNTLQVDILQPLMIEAADLTPDENAEALPPGCEPLIWSVTYGLNAASRKQYSTEASGEIVGAVDQAYYAVFCFHHNRGEFSRSEEQETQLEVNSLECNQEIGFQIGLLSTIEGISGTSPNYASLVKQLK